MEEDLKKMIEEGKKVWAIIKKFPQYKNKTEEDYINYIKSTYNLSSKRGHSNDRKH